MGLREAIFFFVVRGQQSNQRHKRSKLARAAQIAKKKKDRLTRARCGAGERMA
jgi:hypothetical protein